MHELLLRRQILGRYISTDFATHHSHSPHFLDLGNLMAERGKWHQSKPIKTAFHHKHYCSLNRLAWIGRVGNLSKSRNRSFIMHTKAGNSGSFIALMIHSSSKWSDIDVNGGISVPGARSDGCGGLEDELLVVLAWRLMFAFKVRSVAKPQCKWTRHKKMLLRLTSWSTSMALSFCWVSTDICGTRLVSAIGCGWASRGCDNVGIGPSGCTYCWVCEADNGFVRVIGGIPMSRGSCLGNISGRLLYLIHHNHGNQLLMIMWKGTPF